MASDMGEELQLLHNWLRNEMHRDVLIPVAVGEKRPSFPYRDGAWTWEKVDAFLASSQKAHTDWAIILRDVCVVDADTPEVADQLERDWPVCKMVPCEDTAKGARFLICSPLPSAKLSDCSLDSLP